MSRRLVLIVEDSQDLAANLEIACAAIRNVEVLVAQGASQAWQLLDYANASEPLVIVTDLHLADGDGVELIRRIRSDPKWKAAPIIAVSGDASPATAQQLAALRVSAFYKKPYSPVTVRNHLETLLNAAPVQA